MLRVTDDDGATDTDTAQVIVNDAPIAELTADPTSGEVPISINFDARGSTDADGSIIDFLWDWNSDGSYDESSGNNPLASHNFTSPGTYNVTVKVTDNQGSFDTDLIQIVARGWLLENADYGGPVQVGTNTSIAWDPYGRPGISYQARTLNDTLCLKYANRSPTSGWTREIVDAPEGESCGSYTSLDFDASGYPVIAYNYAGSVEDPINDLKIAWKGPSGWDKQILDGDGTGDWNWGFDIALHIYSANKAGIIHHSWYSFESNYLSWDGTNWTVQPMPSDGDLTGFTFDSSGNPVVVMYTYSNLSPTEDFESFWFNGASWDRKVVDSGSGVTGGRISVALAEDGSPAVSFFDDDNSDLKYSKWDGLDWVTDTVYSNGLVGKYNSLRFTPDGIPHIAFSDESEFMLKMAVNDGSGWTISIVDPGAAGKRMGQYCSLAVSETGEIAVAYYQSKINEYGLRFGWYYAG